MIWDSVDHGFDLPDFAILNLEQLEYDEGEGPIEGRADFVFGAVHQFEIAQGSGVVEENGGEYKAFLLIDDRKAAVTHAGYKSEQPGLQLFLTALLRDAVTARISGGLHTVFDSHAIRVEFREEFAGIELNRRKVAVRESD